MISIIKNSFQDAAELLQEFLSSSDNIESINRFAHKIAETIGSGRKLLSCGNGGSMCDAMHFAEELTGRFRDDRISLPAIAISDASHITCTGNDYGFDSIFSRYIEGLGQQGDLLLGISTSGNSPNIVKAFEAADKKGMYSVGLLGKDGGRIKEMANLPIIVPGATSDRIQELHIKIIHISIEAAEKILGL
ncbi:MAG: D-sedoheptulose 7-phosphate isomerase [Proteobacteria bacterium]|nr:D-sedoheptulose 7-phosphate isomerase [Pseudomonadota bacterium]